MKNRAQSYKKVSYRHTKLVCNIIANNLGNLETTNIINALLSFVNKSLISISITPTNIDINDNASRIIARIISVQYFFNP